MVLLFKSNQGIGKDLLTNFILNMTGARYGYRTEDLKNMFGTFNTSIKDKLLFQINVVSR